MKKIAITQRLIENSSYFEIREALDINYSKLLKACGFLPIILPYEVEFEEYFKNIKIDGVLLSGGNDLYSVNQNELSKKRDIYEKKLIEYSIKNGIPLFGICRGVQIIAEYFESTFKKVDNEVNSRSELIVNSSSKYYKSLKNIKEVNSYHNFAIDKLSDDFIVSATSKLGVIKAIEHKKYKIFAQMWHSERENFFSKSEIELIKDFYGVM